MPKVNIKSDSQASILPFVIKDNVSIKEAMRCMGKTAQRILFVINEKKELLGSVTDEDIRQWVLAEGALNKEVKAIYNKKPIFFNESYDLEKVKQVMIEHKIDGVPVLNKNKVIAKIILWSDIFGNRRFSSQEKISIPVVIMAGGKGKRLDPFTKVLPKALIPIGDKAIVEIIMDKYSNFGVQEFYLSINHKSRMIKAFFEEMNTPYRINYIEEDKPLGTAGSLKFIEPKVKTDLCVSNCDIIIEADYAEVYKFHKENKNDITLVSSFRHFVIPYGICKIGKGGRLITIQEKPEYDFLVNTGMYVVKKEILSMIPSKQYYDFTDLINKAIAANRRIGVYPIDEKSWIDVGQWDEYYKSIRNFKT